MEAAITVSHVSKVYNIYDKPRDRLLQMLNRGRKKLYREFWALNDISFSVAPGETVGIVGRNGSGKSTLLQIIAGTLTPSGGSVMTNGRVAALLELGSGFNTEFTGRENVYLNGSLLGLTNREIDDRFDSIAGFADIGRFIDQPVKTYSSGMIVRLAFAVQAQIDPAILIVDEALAVGDAKFQAKCFERLKQLKNNGASILLVTHSSEQVVMHCSRAILLDGGEVKHEGQPRETINRYLDLLFGRDRKVVTADKKEPEAKKAVEKSIAPPAVDSIEITPASAGHLIFDRDAFVERAPYNAYEYRWGDGSASISDFYVESEGVSYPNAIATGARVTLDVGFTINSQMMRPIVGVTLKTKEGVTVYGSNSELLQCDGLETVCESGSRWVARVTFDCHLGPGDYFVSLGIATRHGEEIVPHDRRYDSIHLVVAAESRFFGLSNLYMNMKAGTC
ncbi:MULTISPECIES: ABC transporter ATP-binding protein [unclassified Caballeronia]|uniref:ABC transporter ATP-binding protein n=1 Tax=unclassified Caballeronia TaxID=2646786 RepID=UPI0028597EA7|nr:MULTISPECIES: ABC transporter ATP-binding protein [unclassified Caballeronia]MDR5772364.1 ABC transporter ATP-binding protein [Caballeronia sp. LZ002]MDR5847798.1 ABC transporter ATP-binding protein [Caballeronia sp. LZ003]